MARVNEEMKILILLLALSFTQAFQKGAPLLSCTTMIPSHGTGAQTSRAPYEVQVIRNANDVRVRLVLIGVDSSVSFAGFLVKARIAQSYETVGRFVDVPLDIAILDCGNVSGSAATHRSNDRKASVELDWEAPVEFVGTVVFVATFVERYDSFWTEVKSKPVQFGRNARSPGNHNDDADEEEATYSNIAKINDVLSSIYNGCGSEKNCIASPYGCEASKKCDAIVSIRYAADAYEFEMFSRVPQTKYIAAGLSEDNKMGSDSVVECVQQNGDEIKAYRSWNVPGRKSNQRNDDQSGLVYMNGLYYNDMVYCKVALDPVTTVNGVRYDLNNQRYYVLLAVGTKLKDNSVGYHDKIVRASSAAMQLSEVSESLAQNRDPFYDGCNVNKNCFGSQDGCVIQQNCPAVAAVTVEGDKYTIDLKADQIKNDVPKYVALGFSEDKTMGDDAVIECVMDDQTGRVQAHASYNLLAKDNNRIRQNFLRLTNGSFTDGKIQCTVVIDDGARFEMKGKTFDLKNIQYFLFLASGKELKSNGEGIGFHDMLYASSAEKRFLSDVAAFTSTSKTLLHVHGSFMMIAWLGTASLGIILARYYKQTWIGSQICGKDIWFAWHRFFMLITWLLSLSGAAAIFWDVGGFVTGPSRTHAILGIVANTLTFVQPIGAAFRPHPDSSRRPIFNWLHWLVGNAAHIIAIVAIFLAVDISKAELPKWYDYALAIYVAYYVLMHLILSVMGCMSDKSGGMRVNTIQMKDMGGRGGPPQQFEHRKDAAYSGTRKFLMVLHVLIVVLFTAGSVCLVVYTPFK